MTKAYLSKRALADLRQVDPLRESFAEMQRNPYSKNDNGEGLISLGVAENKLMQEELLQKVTLVCSHDDVLGPRRYCGGD